MARLRSTGRNRYRGGVANGLPLYRRLLGEQFTRLPSVLQRFHDVPGGARARGELRVTRGTGVIARVAGLFGGFPAAGERVPLDLEVRVEGERERWIRRFEDVSLESLQWEEGALFAESAGPVVLLFRLEAEGGAMRFRFVRARMLGIPLPRFASPSAEVDLTQGPTDDTWHIDVRLSAPLAGQILRYEGVIRYE